MESYQINHLSFTYPTRKEAALDNLALSIEAGQFVALVGPSGCGKTTLLRLLKPALSPHGRRFGAVLFEGVDVNSLDLRTQSTRIGFVMQSPENQIVTDKVWHELAFGLESLGMDTPTIRLRVAEMASFFGIQDWFHRPVTELSGGQKQLLSLASIMAMQPSVLILDEPTSRLDPIAASDFLAVVGKINRELGVTVIMTEHRSEEVFPFADRVVVMEKGCIIADGAPAEIGMALKARGHGMFLAMPTPMRVYAATDSVLPCPVTVRDGREWLRQSEIKNTAWQEPPKVLADKAPSVELDEIWFRYEKNTPDIVKGLRFAAYAGEITAILGGNGAGKSTTLMLTAGLLTPYRGTVRLEGKPIAEQKHAFDGLLGVLPQNPQVLFVRKTVREDLFDMLSEAKLNRTEKEARLAQVVGLCRLDGLLDAHPYDLSGGEQQRAALAKVLLLRPRILLLDEPTKGLDAEYKQAFARIIKELAASGVTIVMVSHDIDFCAEHCDRCALFFDGVIVSENEPRGFFTGNSFYTSSANRMARERLPEAVTGGDIIKALGGVAEPDGIASAESGLTDAKALYEGALLNIPAPVKAKKGWIKTACTAMAAMLLLAGIVLTGLHFTALTTLISGGAEATNLAEDGEALRIGVVIGALLLSAGVFWAFSREDESGFTVQVAKDKRKLAARTVMAAALALVAIPLTIFIGIQYWGDRRYFFVSTLIVLETMLPFAFVFESRKPQARELVIIAVLCAIGVAGRTAFFMLPQFKPVAAIVIIAGVAFGGEVGFLVGAMTAFVSNMFFGQGPWTPWQMFAFGLIGFLAGVLFRKGILRRSRAALCVFGGLAVFVLYGFILNTSTLFTFQSSPTLAMLWPALLQGVPFDLVHAAATVIFLWLLSRPMLEKLDRVKVKYGLVDK